MALTPWHEFTSGLLRAVESISDTEVERAARAILAADIVLTAGNGGSSALASHLAQAIAKPGYEPGGGRAAVCISDNIPTLTAHANDGGWAAALAEAAKPWLDLHGIGRRVTLVVISSSGRSENVVRLAQFAKGCGVPVVALTGFSGEPLRSLATVSIHVDSDDYEVVEPMHDAIIHRIQYHLRQGARKD